MTTSEKAYRYVIVGLGKTGLSAARYLHSTGNKFAVTDSRHNPPMLKTFKKEFPHVPLALGEIDKSLLLDSDNVLLSPGVPLQDAAVQTALSNNIEVCGDLELFSRAVTAPILAVTGSNGKSTVVTLLTDMLKAAGKQVELGGNIGTPVLDLLSRDTPDFYVLEVSSFQLETVNSLNASAAVVLNISEDHMDRYEDMAAYAGAKETIFSGDGHMIINRDDAICRRMIRPGRSISSFGSNDISDDQFNLVHQDGDDFLMLGQQKLISCKQMKIKGHHNYMNALAALALGHCMGINIDNMLEALKNFRGLEHRCQWLRKVDEVDWYNDSKGTNVGASSAAIEGLAGDSNLILIAGGVGKDADFSPLTEIARGRVKACICFGRDADQIEAALKSVTKTSYADDLQDAVNKAKQFAEAGDIVVLSPACASFDMFDDYQHRGRTFAKYVKALETTA